MQLSIYIVVFANADTTSSNLLSGIQCLELLVLTNVLGNISCYIELIDGSKHRVQVKNLTEFCDKYKDRIVEKQFDMQPRRQVLV